MALFIRRAGLLARATVVAFSMMAMGGYRRCVSTRPPPSVHAAQPTAPGAEVTAATRKDLEQPFARVVSRDNLYGIFSAIAVDPLLRRVYLGAGWSLMVFAIW